MKFLFSSAFLIVSLIFLQLELGKSLKNRLETRQDAMTSLVIFAKGQAELNRDKQINVLKGQNATAINKIEYKNLMKNRDSINLEKMRQNFTNFTISSANSTQANQTQNGTSSPITNLSSSNNNTTQVGVNMQHNPNIGTHAEMTHKIDKESKDHRANRVKEEKITTENKSERGH